MLDLRVHGLVPLSEMEGALAHAARGVPLHGRGGVIRAFTVVDAEDFEEISQFRWLMSGGYARRCYGGRPPRRRWDHVHRRIMGLERGDPREIDHINRNPLDNRRKNLRIVTHAQNQQNMRAHGGASSYRGVSFDRARGRWTAWGRRNGERVFIGRFDSEEAAAAAALEWRRAHMPYAID